MPFSSLLELTPAGLYCPTGDFYIDPHRAVDRAVVTHAHSDHARSGHRSVLAHPLTLTVIKKRIDARVNGQPVEYGSPLVINGVRLSLHPAGHVPGSAQVRIEHKGLVAVVTGDYKLEHDGLTEPYEQQRCHWFLTECTFGIPAFKWEPQAEVVEKIVRCYEENRSHGTTTILAAYALGKAQRLLHLLAPRIPLICVHRSVGSINGALSKAGLELPEAIGMNAAAARDHTPDRLVIAPSFALRESWVRHLGPSSVYTVSGWVAMQWRGRGGNGFAMSDHADWPGLNRAVRESGAERVTLDHGYVKEFQSALTRNGIAADILGEKSKLHPPGKEGDQLGLPFA